MCSRLGSTQSESLKPNVALLRKIGRCRVCPKNKMKHMYSHRRFCAALFRTHLQPFCLSKCVSIRIFFFLREMQNSIQTFIYAKHMFFFRNRVGENPVYLEFLRIFFLKISDIAMVLPELVLIRGTSVTLGTFMKSFWPIFAWAIRTLFPIRIAR